MNIKVFQNRKVEKDYFYSEGTQNENNITVLTFEVPLGYEDFSKRIVFITEEGNFWDYIPENEYEIKNNITKYGTIEAYLWLTKGDQDFRSQKFELNFYENENADNMTPNEEQLDGFGTLIAELEVKINEINELKPELDKALEKIENYDTDLQGIKSDIAKRLTEEDAKEIFYTETEVDEMVKEIQETNEYQSEIIDQFKNEFKQITVSGDSIYIPNAAELPMDLIPYGEPVQEVIEEEVGTTVEGESVVVTDGDPEKEVKATVNGNSYQFSTEGYNLVNEESFTVPSYFASLVESLKGNLLKTTVLSDGTSPTSISLLLDNFDIEDGKYYVSCDIRLVSGIGTVNDIQMLRSGTTDVTKNNISNPSVNSTFQRYISEYTISNSSEAKVTTFLVQFVNTENAVFEVTNFQISKENSAYEPYTNGASPNIEYPQEVEVVEGVNKFDKDNVEIGALSSDGTNNGDSNYVISNFIKGNNTFTFLYDNLPTDHYIRIGYYDDKKTFIKRDLIEIQATAKKYTFNTTYPYIKISVQNNSIDTYQIVEGTETTPYLPYGHIGLVQRGKNIHDRRIVQGTYQGVSLQNRCFSIQSKEIKKSKQYTVSTNLDTSIYKFAIPLSKTSFPHSQESLFYDSGWRTSKTYTFTPDDNGYMGISIARIDNGSLTPEDIKDYYFMVEEGSTATEFEPYIEPKLIPINLQGNSIAKNDNVEISVSGSVKANKNIFTEKLISSNVKEKSIYGTNAYNISPSKNTKMTFDNIDTVYVLSNYFKGISYSDRTKGIKDAIYTETATNIVVRDTPFSTKEELKAFLDSNDVYIMYQLQTPETIPLPSIEPITLFEGTNVFELITNLGTTMAVTYDYVTPSPSIDRPSEILTVKGGYDTEKQNKNLIKFGKIIGSVHESNGVTFTIKSKTTVNVKGTATEGNAEIFLIGYNWVDSQPMIKLRNNIKYTATMKVNTPNVFAYLIKGASENIANLYTNTKTKIFTADEKGISKIMLRVMKGTTVDEDIELQLEYGENSTEIVEPKNTTLPLTLTKELLGEIVTLTEEEASNLGLDGAGKYRRMDYVKVVLDGTEVISVTNTGTENWFYKIYFNNNAQKFPIGVQNSIEKSIYSNLYLKTNVTNNSTEKGIAIYTYEIRIREDKENTVDNFKARLKELYDNGVPLTIAYKLATPTYEKITDETELAQLSAYDKQIAFFGVNNINTYPTDDLVKAPLKIHATYSKSNKLTIQSLEDRLASLESQVTNLQDNQI